MYISRNSIHINQPFDFYETAIIIILINIYASLKYTISIGLEISTGVVNVHQDCMPRNRQVFEHAKCEGAQP